MAFKKKIYNVERKDLIWDETVLYRKNIQRYKLNDCKIIPKRTVQVFTITKDNRKRIL